MKVLYKSLVITFTFAWKVTYSQTELPLYKMVMNSDIILIVKSQDYKYIKKQSNEFYTENWIKIESIANALKNTNNQYLKGITLRIETDNNDFYHNINGENCAGVGNILENDKQYYSIFFIKKREKKYYVIAHLWNNIMTDDLPYFQRNINDINLISKEKKLKRKKEKINEWFEKSNVSHPSQFIIESPFTDELNNFFLKY